MFGDSSFYMDLAMEILESVSLQDIMEENDLDDAAVLKVLIEEGLVNVSAWEKVFYDEEDA